MGAIGHRVIGLKNRRHQSFAGPDAEFEKLRS